MMNLFRSVLIGLLAIVLLTSTSAFAFSPTAEAGQTLYAGEVVQVLPAGNYTYVLVAVSDAAQIWAAAPRSHVEVGDQVEVPAGLPMENFHSKALDMDFELIYFVDGLTNHSRQQQAPTTKSAIADTSATADQLAQLAPVEGVISLSALFGGKDALSEQQVVVQGLVVKYSAEIMGTNWLHIQDGTMNGAKPYDLTVTSDAKVAVGDVVIVTGIVTVDKNVGAGYHYDVIIENANVSVR